jgi:4-hydroxy-tetrahydrodipicolinate synthase
MFQGLYTALITPFKGGKIDEQAFRSLVEWQITEGVHGLVPCGTTGESPTLSYEEHNRLVSLCVEAARGRVKVLAGTGANSTEEAMMFTRHAKKAGADGALIVSPYYNKPTPEGLYQHYKAITEAADIPVVVYNIPGRSVIDIKDDTMARLATLRGVVGVKDATGDLARVCTLRARVGKTFCQLSGEDMTAVAFNAQGGVGCISVTSNIAPRLCAEVQNKTLKGDFVGALAVHDKLVALHQVMFCETNPIPVKYAASLLGKCTPDMRLPLVEPTEPDKLRIREAMQQAGLL